MVRLVLLNGAPASGKSTLARRYAAEHPPTLALDLDTLRTMLGGWHEDQLASGRRARRLALAAAREQLRDADVLVPQYLGQLDFLLELEALAAEAGAEFLEVAVVFADSGEAVTRFRQRAAAPVTDAHRLAAAVQDQVGGDAALPTMYDRLVQVVAARPRTRVITSVPGEVEQTYQLLLAALDGERP